ncbi:YjgB family protein [Paenibacillus melissococcoides]|uniref:YjgB family protein n=1 Tax=Paenibacillus melissococcoides TaxID=2912268 RepID=A0ABM9GC93_9BACL|nr:MULTISPECIES: YjgB family protein [Paenibacillus]GIO82938.1 hypothetical protein J6TS7_65480 [Paenibacillus dendritiformis]CAH8249614.1 YjgB family protein [Paenibacillus melissococcoides]CAH8721392.1 YjgB family protein [Paenibacillus melissococcoides]CAH8721828.1 YjgB family protein [Paenibacillus melissococcoides]
MQRNTMITMALSLSLALLLSACSTQPAAQAPANTPATATDTASRTPSPSPDASSSEKPPASAPSGDSESSGVTKPEPEKGEPTAEQEVEEMMKLAAEGRVAHSDFAVEHGLMDDVEKEWGEPDKDEFAGQGMYAAYETRHIVFGYNKGMQIFDVRSDDPEVRKLTLEDVEKALGKAKDVRENGGDAIYVYEASADYELKFIVPKPTDKNPNPHVDHISVFYPQGAKNLMAG